VLIVFLLLYRKPLTMYHQCKKTKKAFLYWYFSLSNRWSSNHSNQKV